MGGMWGPPSFGLQSQGLLGPQAQPPTDLAPPPYARKPSIVDRVLGRLFPTAQYTGLLDPQAQQGIQQQGLRQLSANLLVAGGASPMQHGTLANIGAALGGVDVDALANRALQLKAYRDQQQQEQAIAQVSARHPIKPGASRLDQYNRFADIAAEIATIPGGAAIAEKMAPLISAMKPTDRSAREPMRVADVRDNALGSPTHGMTGTVLLDPDTYQRVGFIPQVQASEQAPKPTPQQQQHAEFGAAALAAWRPLDKIRRDHPEVEAEVGKILSSPAFATAIPGFRSSGDAVAAIARAGGSPAAQQYMRASWSFLDNVLRTRYATGRLGGPMMQQMAQEFLPSLDPEGNAQIHQNQVQAILSAQGESGFDLNPQMWKNATKRHGVANIDLQDILSGGTGDANLNKIRDRYR